MRKLWVAVPKDSPEDLYLEDSQRAVEYAIMAGMNISFYRLSLDENDSPQIEAVPEVEL